MRILKIFLFIYISNGLLTAQNTSNVIPTEGSEAGITFIHEKFDEALALAKSSNKTLFIDAYTVWCGPCKMMSKNVFPEKTVADFYNKQFINLKLDMEKGEGPDVAKRYGISAYPTLLFIDGQGQLVHKALGFQDVKEFIEVGKTALEGDKTLSSWTNKYDKGNRDPSFLKEYAQKLTEAYDKRQFEVADEYLKTQQDWLSPENIAFIYRYTEGVDSKLFPFLIKNKKAFASKYDAAEIEVKIQSMVSDRLFNDKNLPTLGFADTLIQMVYPMKVKRMAKNYRLSYYRLKGDREKYAQAAIDYFKKYKASAEELSDVANTFHEQIGDKKLLSKAVKWAKKAVKLDNSYLNNLTLAQLYVDIDDKKNAQLTAEKAIAIAKVSGDGLEEAEAVLKSLKMPQ
jgi:thiol-disulfide isomerase/thioredoxin